MVHCGTRSMEVDIVLALGPGLLPQAGVVICISQGNIICRANARGLENLWHALQLDWCAMLCCCVALLHRATRGVVPAASIPGASPVAATL
jgi:hypothetical protein